MNKNNATEKCNTNLEFWEPWLQDRQNLKLLRPFLESKNGSENVTTYFIRQYCICLWIDPFILPSELFGDLGPINLGMLKQPKLELKRFIRPKTDWFFPNQKVIITILILFLATELGFQHLVPAPLCLDPV